jgi:hypothetical protein
VQRLGKDMSLNDCESPQRPRKGSVRAHGRARVAVGIPSNRLAAEHSGVDHETPNESPAPLPRPA